jgi:hypothetical protein
MDLTLKPHPAQNRFYRLRTIGTIAPNRVSVLGLQALSFRYRLTYPMTETMIEAEVHNVSALDV